MSQHAKFYALLAQMPGANKEELVMQYHPSGSLSELLKSDFKAYNKMLHDMQRYISGDYLQADKWRKMVISAIRGKFTKEGRYLDKTHAETVNLAIKTACRIAQTENFNTISLEKLRSIYNTFKYKR